MTPFVNCPQNRPFSTDRNVPIQTVNVGIDLNQPIFRLELKNYSTLEEEKLKESLSAQLDVLSDFKGEVQLIFSGFSLEAKTANLIREVLTQFLAKNPTISSLALDFQDCEVDQSSWISLAAILITPTPELLQVTVHFGDAFQRDARYGYFGDLTHSRAIEESIKSRDCIKKLHLVIPYLSPGMSNALKYNSSVTVEVPIIDYRTREVKFIQERNRLLRCYPTHQQEILYFCQGHDLYLTVSSEPYIADELRLKSYQGLPAAVLDFFHQVYNASLNSISSVKGLNQSSGGQLINHDTSDLLFLLVQKSIRSQEEFDQLCAQIVQKKDFTGFLIMDAPSRYREDLISLLALTAMRNILIKAWPDGKIDEASLKNPQLFTAKLLAYLANNKSIPSDFLKKALTYCAHAFSHFQAPTDDLFNLVLKTGILPLVDIFCNQFSSFLGRLINNNRDFGSLTKLFYVAAVQSGSKEIILYLEKLYKQVGQWEGFIWPATIQNLAKANINLTSDQITLFNELINEKELVDIRNHLQSNDLKDKIETIQKHQLSKADLIRMGMAERLDINRIIPNVLNLDLPDPLNVINFDEFSDDILMPIATGGFLKNEELLDCLSRRKSIDISSAQLTSLLQHYSNDPNILALLAERFPTIFNSTHLYLIINKATETATPRTDLSEFFYKLSAETLIQDNFLEYLYLLSRSAEGELLEIQHFPFGSILLGRATDLILKQNSVSMMGLLVAHGYDLKPTGAIDYRRILLTAILYVPDYVPDPGRKMQLCKELQSLDPVAYPQEVIHELFSEKLSNTSTTITDADAHAAKKVVDTQNRAATIIQGAVRTGNRINELYQKLFSPSQNTFLFWMEEKAKLRLESLSEEFCLFALPYLDSHSTNPSDSYLFSLIPRTTQYVKENSNFINIIKTGNLLSEDARIRADMHKFPTNNEESDRRVKDNLLVCTAPLKYAVPDGVAKITIRLSKLPKHYLQHCIVKLMDFAGKVKEITCQITPTISMTVLRNDDSRMRDDDFSKSVYQLTNHETGASCQIDVPGENEIFHGIAGLQEALMHALYVMDSVPDVDIKKDIREHFEELRKENRLNNHLDTIFKELFQHMEIDFQRGLPLSFTYIESIEVDRDKKIDLVKFLEFAKKGDLLSINHYIENYPDIVGQPFFIRALLEQLHPFYFQHVSSMLEQRFPDAYVEALHCVGIHDQYLFPLKVQMNELAVEPPLSPKYDFPKLLNELEGYLRKNPKERRRLMDTHKDAVTKITQQVQGIYSDFTNAGGNSKIIEVLTNPHLMGLMTGKNSEVMLAILAFEVHNELTPSLSSVTLIDTKTSQRTHKVMTITLGSILKQGLTIPPSFVEVTPVNRSGQLSEHETIRTHIKQRYYFRHIYKALERSLIGLINHASIDVQDLTINVPSSEGSSYVARLRNIIAVIPANYATNPEIINDVNHGLKELATLLKLDTPPTLDELVKMLLTSSAILDFVIAHALFDTTHFAVALQGKGIHKIQLADAEISFAELIQVCMEKIDATRNPAYAMMAQQLMTKIEWLRLELKMRA